MIVTTLLVVALSEVRLYLYASSPFRFGLGTVAMMAVVVLDQTLPSVWLGISSGLTFLAARVSLGLMTPSVYPATSALERALSVAHDYLPAALTLVVTGVLLRAFAVRRWMKSPLTGFIALMIVDLLATYCQFLIRPIWRTYSTMQLSVIIALIRAATVSGLYWMFRAKLDSIAAQEQRKQYEQLLLLLASLNTEVFYLQKSAHDLNRITATSVQLVKGGESGRTAELALSIAKDAHDLSADYRRILNGLARLVQVRPAADTLRFSRVLDLVVESNLKAVRRQGKEFTITARVEPDFDTASYMVWVSILNNLVANSVEAGERKGRVEIDATVRDGWLHVRIWDNGPGVDEADIPLLFKPGFTTKFDPDSGQASRGLGLAHVTSLLGAIEGEAEVVHASPGNMCIQLRVPLSNATDHFPGMGPVTEERQQPGPIKGRVDSSSGYVRPPRPP